MDPEIKKLWIEALRSDDYEQGKSYLHSISNVGDDKEHRYCCLGVLCEIAIKQGLPIVDKLQENIVFSSRQTVITYDGQRSVLPGSVAAWANITSDGSYIPKRPAELHNYKSGALTHDNDKGMTFAEIASIIDEYF